MDGTKLSFLVPRPMKLSAKKAEKWAFERLAGCLPIIAQGIQCADQATRVELGMLAYDLKLLVDDCFMGKPVEFEVDGQRDFAESTLGLARIISFIEKDGFEHEEYGYLARILVERLEATKGAATTSGGA